MAKNNSEMKSIRKKLVAAVAMVLVASVMVVSSSYAWFTLSTAPEVKGIQTAVGSNGNLEIALRTGNLGDITSMSQGGGNFPEANGFWGNLIDLSDPSYGMSNIQLAPARLNISVSTTMREISTTVTIDTKDWTEKNAEDKLTYNGYEIKDNKTTAVADGEKWAHTFTYIHTTSTYKLASNQYYLQTPVYAEDGRIKALEANGEIGNYSEDTRTFTVGGTTKYGVRAIGVLSGLSDAALALRNAKNTVNSTISSATTAAQNSMNLDGSKLANIILKDAMNTAGNTTLNNAERQQIVDAITNLKKIAVSLRNALDQSVIAIGVQQDKTVNVVTVTADAITTDAVANGATADIDWSTLPAEKASLLKAYAALATMDTNLAAAEGAVPAVNDSGSYEYSAFTTALSKLMDTNSIKVQIGNSDEMKVADFRSSVMSYANNILKGDKIYINIYSGIYAEIAAFVDNYTGTASVEVDGSLISSTMANEKFTLEPVLQTKVQKPTFTYADEDVTKTVTEFYLPNVSEWLSKLTANDAGQTGGTSLSDLYGYIVDFAFRTNAANSSLLLQTSGTSRVGNNDAAVVQGAGSYMEFTLGSGSGYTVEQMIELMKAIRVVFVDDATNVLAIAALDMTPYDEDTNSNGYTIVGDKVNAKLFLHTFSIATGGALTLGDKITDAAAITALEQNVATGISAMVYMDGDMVENGDVAINGTSMTGTMNLQFASSAQLVPMQYTFTEQAKLGTPDVSISGDSLTINKVEGAATYEVYYLGAKIGEVAASDADSVTYNLSNKIQELVEAGTLQNGNSLNFDVYAVPATTDTEHAKSDAKAVTYTYTAPTT